MSEQELLSIAQDMLSFIDSTFQYQGLLDYMIEQGHDEDTIDKVLENISNGNI